MKVARDEVERAARIYRTNKAAAAAMGISATTFDKLCRKYGVDSPHARSQRAKA